jgi:hypothetical protein
LTIFDFEVFKSFPASLPTRFDVVIIWLLSPANHHANVTKQPWKTLRFRRNGQPKKETRDAGRTAAAPTAISHLIFAWRNQLICNGSARAPKVLNFAQERE